MRLKLEGNRLYRCFRVFATSDILWVVAKDNAHARRICLQYRKDHGVVLPEDNDSFAVSWYIYDNNRGITPLPLGSIAIDHR